MRAEKLKLDGVILLHPDVFGDNRGWFKETYSKQKMEACGITAEFVQDNHSYSKSKGIIRGLHFQNPPFAQAKIVRCTRGRIMDVAVDLRKDSPNYKKWISVELSADNHCELFIPKGFAHGFVSLEDEIELEYKVDAPYSKEHDRSIRYDDPEIGVEWGISDPILSEKDRNAPFLKDSDCMF